MSAIATAKRRRRQAKMNNAHVAKLGRRIYGYGNASSEKLARRERAKIEKLQAIARRKGMKKS